MTALVVINGPVELWWAPVATAFPVVSAAPAAEWNLIGTSGDSNYTDDGVTINTSQTVEDFIPLGETFPIKSFRTEEEVTISVRIADLSLAQFRVALNLNTVTTNAGIDDEVSLERGVDVSTMALLCRGTGKSPEFAGGNLQFELYMVRESGSQELGFVKGEPVGVQLEFRALKDLTNGVGTLRAAIA